MVNWFLATHLLVNTLLIWLLVGIHIISISFFLCIWHRACNSTLRHLSLISLVLWIQSSISSPKNIHQVSQPQYKFNQYWNVYWHKFQQPSQWRKSMWTNIIYHRQRKLELCISVELIKNKTCSPVNLSCWNLIYDWWMQYLSLQHKLLIISSNNIISRT